MVEGSFGIMEGDSQQPQKVKVSFQETLFDYINTRKWYPTQKISAVKDGKFTLELELSRFEEFIPWVLSFGREATVLKPGFLREKIQEELAATLKIYKKK